MKSSADEKRQRLAELLRKKSRVPRDYPPSYAQERLWFIEQLRPDDTSYNLISRLQIAKKINLTIMQRAINEIVQRHEILRTIFPAVDGQPVQRVLPEQHVTISTIDLAHLTDEEAEAEARERTRLQTDMPFDIANGPLLRAELLRLRQGDRLLLAVHHIAVDAWSFDVLLRDLNVIYYAFNSGLPSPLPKLELQYADWSQWQRRILTGERLDQQLAYWKEVLQGLPPLLLLPTDRPRPAVHSGQGSSHSVRLPKQLRDQLVALGHTEDATLFMTLLAGFVALIHRWSGEADVAVGTPMSNRSRAELEHLIGLFTNTVVLRVGVQPQDTFRSLLVRAREATVAAFANQDLSFEKLVEALQHPRSLSYNPVFQVMLVVQTREPTPLPAPLSAPVVTTSKFDLSFNVVDTGHYLEVLISWSTDLFDASTMDHLGTLWERLLSSVCAAPDRRLSELCFVSAEETRMLEQWSGESFLQPIEESIPSSFAALVKRIPDAIAMEAGENSVTYRELFDKAQRVERALRARHIAPEKKVGFACTYSPDMVAGLLGILSAGGGIVCLPPQLSSDRTAQIVGDARPEVLLVEPELESRLAGLSPPLLLYDETLDGPGGLHQSPPLMNSLACVMYQPWSARLSGIALDHTALTHLANGTARTLNLSSGHRVAIFSDGGWDGSLDLILASVLSGGTLVRVDTSRISELSRVIEENRITVLSLSLDAWNRWVLASAGAYDLTTSSLRLVLLTGVMPDRTVIHAAFARWQRLWADDVRLVLRYGPPELPFGGMWHELTEAGDSLWVKVGTPLDGFTARVVDEFGHRTPIGMPGTLYFGGPAVGRAMWQQPALTAGRMVPDAFGSRPGERLLRSHETARVRADGVFEIRQQKVAEVHEAKTAELRALPTGNADVESRLTAIWTEVLGKENIGVHDNFFMLGGHSLAATRVVARIRKAFSIEFPLRVLFEQPTVAALVRYVESEKNTENAGIRRRLVDGEIPLSYAQERLWFLAQLEPESATYNIPIAMRWQGSLNLKLIERALNEIVRRHETLRTVFPDIDGHPSQRVLPELEILLTVIDLRDEPRISRIATARRIFEEDADIPFNLATGPLLRAQIVQLAGNEYWLLLTIHHIISDGWSFDVLFSELQTIYKAFVEDRAIPLSPLELQYSDWARWQREELTGDKLAKLVAYWRTMLENAPPVLELPTDRPYPPVQKFRGATHGFRLLPALQRKIEALGQAEGTTLFMTLLTGFYALLSRWTGQADLVVGTPIANRTQTELEGMIGFFVNTLALHACVEPNDTFRTLLRRVREITLSALAHQDLPFEKLVEELQPARSLSHNPLFQVMFVLQNTPSTNTDQVLREDDEINFGAPPGGTAKFDLSLFVMEDGQGLVVGIEYSAELFDADTIKRLGDRFCRLLGAALDEPDASLATLKLLSESEAETCLATSRGPAAFDFVPVAALVIEQAARTPDAIALRDGNDFSYAELAALVRKIATHIAQRTEPGARVAVCAGRTSNAVAATIAILLSGRTYVPLEPAYPVEFLRTMVEDVRLSLVLVESGIDVTPFEDIPLSLIDEIEAVNEPLPKAPELSDAIAYIVYTSGSTGRPKGVAVPQRVLSNLIQWQIQRSRLPAGARTLQFAARSFDVSVQEIFSTLCAGGTLVVADEETRRDPELLLKCLAENTINRLFLPPAALQQLASTASGAAPPSLQEIIIAGEQLTLTEPIAQFLKRSPHLRLYNQYGPSETHVVTEYLIDSTNSILPPIGYPLPGVAAYVLDAALQPVGVDCPGDLYLGGTCVAQGYFNRPALTAERFVPDPFSAGGRLYRTGDRARVRAEGALEFLGRSDDQVKVRGFRIEPGEIEAVLQSHPAVRTAAVTAAGEGARRSLAAFVVPDSHGPIVPAELRSFLRARLPDHLIPASFTELPSLPQMPSGKIDRRALPRLIHAIEEHRPHVEPSSPVERGLAGIWREVLAIERVGIHDNFFDLGGHSLLATQVASRARAAFQVDLPLRVLFEQPTLESLALAVVSEQAKRAGDDTARLLAEIERLPDDEIRRRRSQAL